MDSSGQLPSPRRPDESPSQILALPLGLCLCERSQLNIWFTHSLNCMKPCRSLGLWFKTDDFFSGCTVTYNIFYFSSWDLLTNPLQCVNCVRFE